MDKPTLLVLAASLYQLDVIHTAKKLGYRVITTDNIPSNPGHRFADKAYNIDITDRNAVLEIAKQEKIDGVIAACTDVGVPTAAFVAHHCGLPGPPWPEAQILTNKVLFRQFLGKEKLPVPEHYEIDINTPGVKKLFDGRKWIIKPDHSSGSKGIFIINSLKEFTDFLPETLGFSSAGIAVLEHFLDGVQGTCEGIVRNGCIESYTVMDRQTVKPPFVATCGQSVPSRFEAVVVKELLVQLNTIFATLRLKNSLFDCDFLVYENRVYLLEVSPRLGGNSISKLLARALDFDIIEYGIQLACGDESDNLFPTDEKPTAVLLFGCNASGKLQFNEDGYAWAQKQAWVDHIEFDCLPGSMVSPFINGRHRIGEALIHAATRDELDERMESLKKNLAISVY